MSWLLGVLQMVLNLIASTATRILNWIAGLLGALWDGAWDLIGQAVSWGVGQLPEGAKEVLNTVPWASMHSYMDDVNWFIPIYGLLSVVLTTLGLAGSIRLARWVKSFIPTISG